MASNNLSDSSEVAQPDCNSMFNMALESPPAIVASSSRHASESSPPPPPYSLRDPPSSTQDSPVLMELPSRVSSSSIDTSPFHQPSSRRLFHDTPTASQHSLVSPRASSAVQYEAHTPTASGAAGDQDVFGKIDHTPLRQETHSTSPLPNSRSFQTGDMLDHVLDSSQFQRLAVGNVIAPERGSSKKPPKRLPTDPNSTTASPTPVSRSTLRSRSALTSIAVNRSTSSPGNPATDSSPRSDPFIQRSHPSADELSLHVKHQMAALQEGSQT